MTLKPHMLEGHDFALDGTLDATKVAHFVSVSGNNKVGLCTGGLPELGVLYDHRSGPVGCVVLAGNVEVVAGVDLLAGDAVDSGTDGRAVKGHARARVVVGATTGNKALVSIASQFSRSGGRAPGAFFQATALLVGKEEVITQDATWQELGGIVTNPGFFVGDLNKVIVQLTGAVKAVGAGAKVRFVQKDTPGGDVVLGTWDVDDSTDAWGPYTQQSVPGTPAPVGGTNYCFVIEGKLDGATSASIKWASVSLLEVLM